MILVFGKARSLRAPNLGCREDGAESLGRFDVSPKKLCMRRDAWVGRCRDEAANHQLVIVAHSCGLLNHPNSFHRGMFKLNAKFDADSLLYLLSHFEYDGHTVHMLTQWHLLPPLTNTVMSSLFTHMHSSPLSLAARLHRCHTNCSRHINNGGLFLDRPHGSPRAPKKSCKAF